MRSTDDKAVRGGFTLVEILITIAILGILVMIAVGNFGGINEKYKVEAETKQLYADLMDARGRAMQRNRMFFVRFSGTGIGYTRYATYEDTNTSPDGNGIWDNTADTRVASVAVTHGIITALPGELRFQPERHRLRHGEYPILVDRITRLRLHYDPADENQDGAVQWRGLR